jgi:hypothetical protein
MPENLMHQVGLHDPEDGVTPDILQRKIYEMGIRIDANGVRAWHINASYETERLTDFPKDFDLS